VWASVGLFKRFSGTPRGDLSDAGTWGSRDERSERVSPRADSVARPPAERHIPGGCYSPWHLSAARSSNRRQSSPTESGSVTATTETPRSSARSLLFPPLQPADRADVPPAREALHLYERDLADSWGRVQIPEARDRKYPNASADWRWQWVFPTTMISTHQEKKLRDSRQKCSGGL